ncbi:hypothetical protein EP10_002998 [Geobacillus icigianus]|uniref:Uncharacterized protein n=1 Tax=Geobacillus icigianus TaxID=1430331 RepID=A0ABU6BJN8_9BACL|nr:hypothetical protein [Geobacillus icigianus]
MKRNRPFWLGLLARLPLQNDKVERLLRFPVDLRVGMFRIGPRLLERIGVKVIVKRFVPMATHGCSPRCRNVPGRAVGRTVPRCGC